MAYFLKELRSSSLGCSELISFQVLTLMVFESAPCSIKKPIYRFGVELFRLLGVLKKVMLSKLL